MNRPQRNTSASTAGMMSQKPPQNLAPVSPAGAPSVPSPSEKSDARQWLAVVNNSLKAQVRSVEALLPKGHSAERFMASTYLYVRMRPELWGVEPSKILHEAFKAAQQGLDFGIPNEAHLVRYKDNISLIRGYKGDMKMARRTPGVDFLDANEVCEADTFDYEMGDTPRLTHKHPALGEDRGAIIGFYAVAKVHGNVQALVRANAEIWQHAKRFTRATKSGPFAGVVERGPAADNWRPYGLKTCLIALCTQKLDLTSEMANQMVQEFEAERGEPNVTAGLGDQFDLPTEPEPPATNPVDEKRESESDDERYRREVAEAEQELEREDEKRRETQMEISS